jgi:hypothetical protein
MIPEEGSLLSHRRDNLKSYKSDSSLTFPVLDLREPFSSSIALSYFDV